MGLPMLTAVARLGFLLAFVCFSARHLKTVSAKISKSKLDVEMFPMSPGKPFILDSKGQR